MSSSAISANHPCPSIGPEAFQSPLVFRSSSRLRPVERSGSFARARRASRKALPVYCKCGHARPIVAHYDQSSSLRTMPMVSYFRAVLALILVQRRSVGGFLLGFWRRSRRHLSAEGVAACSCLLLLLRQ